MAAGVDSKLLKVRMLSTVGSCERKPAGSCGFYRSRSGVRASRTE